MLSLSLELECTGMTDELKMILSGAGIENRPK